MPHDYRGLTLTDTGPIVAVLDPADKNHARCWQAMRDLPYSGIVAPTACLVEILYLLGKSGGLDHQRKLWTMVRSGALHLRATSVTECLEAANLMELYSDVPMDFADAVLVVTADALDVDTIFTLDRHFYAYRRLKGSALHVIPG